MGKRKEVEHRRKQGGGGGSVNKARGDGPTKGRKKGWISGGEGGVDRRKEEGGSGLEKGGGHIGGGWGGGECDTMQDNQRLQPLLVNLSY